MKIVSIVTSFPRNDKDILIPWIIRLVKELQSEKIETEIFTSSYCGIRNEMRDGIKVKRFRYFFKKWEKLSHDMSVPEKLKSNKLYFLVLPFFMFFGTVAALNYARKNHFDVIHVHFPFPLAVFGIVMKIISGKPIIMTCHGSEVNMAKRNRVFRSIFRWMISYADSITVNSVFMKNELARIAEDRKIEIIPMGTGVSGRNGLTAEDVRCNDRKKILFVGRLIELKGLIYLIEAVKMLDAEKYELHIVGDGPQKEKLKNEVEKYFKKKQVFFHGYLKDRELENMYLSADIFVLPSIVDDQGYTEGLGTVLLEAISYDIPVIGSDTGGITDIIINGKTGILVEQKDPESIFKAILKLSDDSVLRGECVKNARQHLSNNFSWWAIRRKFVDEYKKLLNQI